MNVWEPFADVLACSQCGGTLSPEAGGVQCGGCAAHFPLTATGGLDLRLQSPKKYPLQFELGGLRVPPDFKFLPLPMNPRPEVAFPSGDVPWHLTPELLSYLPAARAANSVALDLGCGDGIHRSVCEAAGFRWIGLDYTAADAPILGDGHALPFTSNSIELVFSIAVLEHIQYPFVVAREVFRVLKPGGAYIGTVAFLEPFHGNSFYHHTHLGTYNTLRSAGFTVERVGPNPHWSGLRAQVSMGGLFPKMPPLMGRALIWPLEVLHRLWWKVGRRLSPRSNSSEETRLVANAGAFKFVARKPADATAAGAT